MRKAPFLRIARRSRDLEAARDFYTRGLGLQVLVAFEDHEGFDGVILGDATWPYELEFTRDRHAPVVPAPTDEDLLVFCLADEAEWHDAIERLRSYGATEAAPSNPYWGRGGLTFLDADGYRLVIYRESTRNPAQGDSA